MSAGSHTAAPTSLQKKAAGLRYKKLGYVAIDVTDIARSRHFYESLLGMEVTDVGADGEVLLRCSDAHHDIILFPAARAGLRRISWQLESDVEFEKVAALVDRLQLPFAEVLPAELDGLRQGRTVRIQEPYTGTCLEFYANGNDGYAFSPSVAKIQRLGHVVLTTSDYDNTIKFYTNDLNFQVSDTIEERTTFMRCFPNPFHHSLGVAKDSKSSFQHVNFMVSEIDDIGKGFWRFQKNGVPIVFGPGRHPPSNSVFLYASDPDRITVEYSYGMEEFPELGARPARTLPFSPESVDTWGAPLPNFGTSIPVNGQFT